MELFLLLIFRLAIFFLSRQKALYSLFYILHFLIAGFLLSSSFDLFENHNFIKKGVFEKIKKFIYLNCFLWFVYGLYLCYFPTVLISIRSFIIDDLMILCLFYLAVASAIWIYQLIYCVIFLKEHLLIRSAINPIIKVVHSILISINGWLLILLNLFNFAKLSQPLSVIYAVISSSTILFYPSLNMFEYMSKEVYKFNKQKEKEEIENESNGSKNYTA